METTVISKLREEFPIIEAPLKHRNAFELLIAVILSAQCTDARVNTVTPKLFPKDRACEPQDLLNLGEDEIKKRIFSCGYYNSKARAIWESSLMLKQNAYPQGVPDTLKELTALPGVGEKTAQVLLSQWFKQAAFPVDTHVHRVCNRLGLANSGKNRHLTERQVKARIPKEEWSDLHLRLVFHGRKTCTAFHPKCDRCTLREECASFQKNCPKHDAPLP